MQYPKITIAVLLLPSALALPSTNGGHGHGHKHGHRPYKSGGVSGAPFPSGTGGAPFGLNNGTSSAAGTGTGSLSSSNTIYTTIQSTIYQTIPASGTGEAPAESATAAAESGSGDCAAPVTVTYNPTVTVTVTSNGGSPAESGVESSAAVSSSSAVIASASSAPEASETVAPVSSSAAPVVSSPAPAAATSPAAAPTQAASSASTASSVAPVQSVSASPVGLSPQSVPVSPSVAASSTTAAAATGNTATPATGPGSTKRGMVIPAGGADQADQVAMVNKYPQISWVSNWYSSAPPLLNNETAEFVPQMYGLNSDSDWDKNAEAMIQDGSKHFLSFGEPETYTTEGPQLHQDSATAAINWKNWMAKYATTGPVGSPCTLQSYDPDQEWQTSFLEDCDGCDIGFVAMHWVDKAPPGKGAFQAQGFQEVVNNYTAIAAGKPVWIDNIQASGANADQMDFLKVIVPWLESNEKVQRYSYWSPDKSTGTGFLNSDGSVSELGNWYATYTS